MAINYTKVGWDTSKYVNPTNMNQMDDGIKAACDGVDAISANYIKAATTGTQSITTNNDDTPLRTASSNATKCWLQIVSGAGSTKIGAVNNKPYFRGTGGDEHEIALKEDVVMKYKTFSATTSANAQSKLGYYVSMDVRMANYTPISAFVVGSSALQGFCTINESGTLYLWAASADNYTVKVLYAKTDTLIAG